MSLRGWSRTGGARPPARCGALGTGPGGDGWLVKVGATGKVDWWKKISEDRPQSFVPLADGSSYALWDDTIHRLDAAGVEKARAKVDPAGGRLFAGGLMRVPETRTAGLRATVDVFNFDGKKVETVDWPFAEEEVGQAEPDGDGLLASVMVEGQAGDKQFLVHIDGRGAVRWRTPNGLAIQYLRARNGDVVVLTMATGATDPANGPWRVVRYRPP
jgi:hypothetical protein